MNTRNLSRKTAFAVGMLIYIGFPTVGRPANWYVDSGAIDFRRDGKTWATAWTTLGSIAWGSLCPQDVVWVRGGPYNERMAVGKSGASAEARIILKGIDSPVIRGIDGRNANYIAVIGFEITQLGVENNYAAIRMDGGTGWLIQDNFIHDTYGAGIDGRVNTVNSFDVIRANTLDNIGGKGEGASNGIAITMTGNSNLIEYNTIMRSQDRVQSFGTGDVVRNNYWGATDTTLYPKSHPYPYHNDGYQSFDTANPLKKFLYECNWDTDNKDSVGGTNAHGCTVQNYGAPGLLNWMIFRFNVLVRSGGPAFIFMNIDRIYAYNLTSVKIENGAFRRFQNGVAYNSGSGCDLQDWRNNTWTYSPNTVDRAGIFAVANRGTRFTSDFQHSYDAGILPFAAHNLASVDPQFADPGNDDYTLKPDSPLRGAGGPLTSAVGSGRDSTVLTVVDSRKLFDGWGMTEGDTIKVGSGKYSRILSIDYNANVVVLASPRSWSNGDSVIVEGMEDIGALPYSYALPYTVRETTTVSTDAGPSALSASCTNSNAVRKIEFLVDGIPIGERTSEPYTIPWISDGKAHCIEARAYSRWASRTLWKSAVIMYPAPRS